MFYIKIKTIPKIRIRRPFNDNPHILKNDNKFMKGSYEQGFTEHLVKEKVKEMAEKGKNRAEIIQHLSKRGYTKTETDIKIVQSILSKSDIKDGEIPKTKPNKFMENIRRENARRRKT